jgi:hypothetical protein
MRPFGSNSARQRTFEQTDGFCCEGIVSKRRGSHLSLRPLDGVGQDQENPAAPAVRREAEEEWN